MASSPNPMLAGCQRGPQGKLAAEGCRGVASCPGHALNGPWASRLRAAAGGPWELLQGALGWGCEALGSLGIRPRLWFGPLLATFPARCPPRPLARPLNGVLTSSALRREKPQPEVKGLA